MCSLSNLLPTIRSMSVRRNDPELPRVAEETDNDQDVVEYIDRTLRCAMQTHMDEKIQISQPQLLREILNKETIMRLFRQYKATRPHWRDIDVDNLCSEVRTNHIRVLAILILFRMGHAIIQLQEDGVSDAKLPLTYTDEKEVKDLHLAKEPKTPLKCFQDKQWIIQMKIDICRTQWHLDVPYLKMQSDSGPEHRDFQCDVVLPWCKPENLPREPVQGTNIEENGGYSLVRRVHIHPGYHGFHEVLDKIGLSSCSNNFALKILNPESNKELDKMYQNEIKQLKSFNGMRSKHLVTLLTTFTHSEKRHFLFPWATCDLFSYWKDQQTDPQKVDNARWLSKQFKGIVKAVHTIHNPPHIEHIYGRHGDLKPDNILWYKHHKGNPNGILVVSDMGFTVAHSTYSRSKDAPGNVARTPEYRPPEIDTKEVHVSRKYDVWTLGCIFLEMLTWFLGGEAERLKFREGRKTPPDGLGAKIPTFFQLEEQLGHEANVEEDAKEIIKASIKQSVLNGMNKIRMHRYRSHFTDDVVDIVQNYMILVDPSERAGSEFLREQFTKINEKCQSDQKYISAAFDSENV
ncbi:kinase-like domain-containing protein [Xylaria flabelliformis]|nr:kinase-like domain-containing protein [Xylaria flabelliformis]